MRRPVLAIVPISLALATTTFALPPGAEQRGFRDGANHHLGDDSFVARVGRAPTSADSEQLRMQTHLTYVRELLAHRPPTRPELAARRAELLGYLDEYIAKGVAPRNEALPWRSPVFIDDDGNICAVGYLIQRSVGRARAEQIARAHRYDFLEDIAGAMPEVRAWVESSGLTLDELASIQPGYEQPAVEDWVRWNVAKLPPPDGAYRDAVTTGAWRHRRMEGTWTRTAGDAVVGRGELRHGSGTWTSFYPDGSKMAEGPMVRNDPDGAWTLFHPSGNVAAEGRFTRGLRDGEWRFYYDTRRRTPIATGSFARGALVGEWRHYDLAGKLLARSTTTSSGDGFGQYLLHVVPGRDGVVHEVDMIGGPDVNRLDAFVHGGERLYVFQPARDDIYDADGNQLTTDGHTWFAAPCHWSAKRRRIAHAADISTLHELLSGFHFQRDKPEPVCGAPVAVSAARARRIEHLLAQQHLVRSVTPEFVRRLALGHELVGPDAGDDSHLPDEYGSEDAGSLDDLPELLAANMIWYIEWPHIDRRFIRLFRTIPGYWRGRPNGQVLPESEREQVEDLVDTRSADASLSL
jgi:hypothetical protein